MRSHSSSLTNQKLPLLPVWRFNKCHTNPQPLDAEIRECHNCTAPLRCQTRFLSLPIHKQPSPSSLKCYHLDLTHCKVFCSIVCEGSNTRIDSLHSVGFHKLTPYKGYNSHVTGHTVSPLVNTGCRKRKIKPHFVSI